MPKPPEELLELIIPVPDVQPSDQLRHAVARGAFLLALWQDQGDALNTLFARWFEYGEKKRPAALRRMHAEAELFTRGVRLPSPWLVLAVLRAFFIMDKLIRKDQIPEPYVQRIPEAALRAFYPDSSRTRNPKDGGAHIAEWAYWFYRVRVRGESIRSIAKEYHEKDHHPRPFESSETEEGCDCRYPIKYGLAQVAPILDTPDLPPLAPLVK